MRPRHLVTATALVGAVAAVAMVTATSAEACFWNFGSATQPPDLALNTAFASGTVFAGQATPGTTCGSSLTLSTNDTGADPLFNKNLGGVELGIGLITDPSGENEVTPGHNISINISNVIGRTGPMALSVDVDSVQVGLGGASNDEWALLEGGTTLASGTAPTYVNNTEVPFTLVDPADTVLTFEAVAGNVLLGSFDSPEQTAVPEPATLALLGTGFIGFAAMRRRRRG
jgi:hypothetical protein